MKFCLSFHLRWTSIESNNSIITEKKTLMMKIYYSLTDNYGKRIELAEFLSKSLSFMLNNLFFDQILNLIN